MPARRCSEARRGAPAVLLKDLLLFLFLRPGRVLLSSGLLELWEMCFLLESGIFFFLFILYNVFIYSVIYLARFYAQREA